MKTFVACDVQNLFHGLVRLTGDTHARIDYVRLRSVISVPGEDTVLTAYIVTPVESVEQHEKSLVPAEDQTGFVDDTFVSLLKKLGYRVNRSFCAMRVNETEEARYVTYVRTSMARAVFNDVKLALNYCDKVVLVSGAGALLPTASMVKEAGKELWVVAFTRSGDMNSAYKNIADKVVSLDETLRWNSGRLKKK